MLFMNGKQFLQNFNNKFVMQNFNHKFVMQKLSENIFTTNYFGLNKFQNSTVFEITFPENASIIMQKRNHYFDKFTSSEFIIKNILTYDEYKDQTIWPYSGSPKKYYYSTFDILHIPYEDIDKNISYLHFMRTKQLNFIPKEFITKEMADYYYELTGDILQIPENHLDYKMCEEYFLKTRFLKGIPSEFRKKLIEKFL